MERVCCARKRWAVTTSLGATLHARLLAAPGARMHWQWRSIMEKHPGPLGSCALFRPGSWAQSAAAPRPNRRRKWGWLGSAYAHLAQPRADARLASVASLQPPPSIQAAADSSSLPPECPPRTHHRHHGKRVCLPPLPLYPRWTLALTLASWSIFIGLAFIVIFSAAAWFLAPKGENQTYVSLR